MLKRKVLIRVFLSFAITFFPTVLLIYLGFQKLSHEQVIKERDGLHASFKKIIEHEIKVVSEIQKTQQIQKIQKGEGYLIAVEVYEKCDEVVHFRILDKGIYFGNKRIIDGRCYFLGVNLAEQLEMIKNINDADWLILYIRSYIDKFPQEFRDKFVKDKIFKENVVIAGFSKEALLNLPYEVKGYSVYGDHWKKNLIVEFPLVDSGYYQFGKVLFVKDISHTYANFYTLMAVLVGYAFTLSSLSSLLLYKLSEDMVVRIIKLQEFSNRVKKREFDRVELFQISKPSDELDHLRNNLVDMAKTIGNLLFELEAKNKELHELAYYDPLTGLPNRRFFFEHTNLIFEEVKRYGKKLSLLSLDVDHFKKINDTYGHDAGDAVLKAFANVLRSSVRHSDICARMGGEEFVVLLPNTNLEGARILAERIRRAVSSNPVEYGNSMIIVTTSIGVAEFRKGMENIDQLIKDADIALYRAKERGKNKVEVFIPEEREEFQT